MSKISDFRKKLKSNPETAKLLMPGTKYEALLDLDGDGKMDFALMDTTGERDGFTVRGEAYFKQLLEALGDHAALHVAYLEDKPIAGTIAIYYGDKTWYLYGASSNEHRDAMPNYLLQWHMIQDAIALGHRIYDFRGVSGDLSEDNPLYGLYRFKKGFSGDYTKFTGLFIYRIKPLTSRFFLFAMKHRSTFGKLLKIFKK